MSPELSAIKGSGRLHLFRLYLLRLSLTTLISLLTCLTE